jgi:hypothetical protein
MANVELEIVDYNIPKIEEVGQKLVVLFAKYSKIEGTAQWLFEDLIKLRADIRAQKQKGRLLEADGLEVSFSGFLKPVPVVKDDKIVLQTREPRFKIEEKPEVLRPRARTYLQNVTEAIAMEMNEAYHLRNLNSSPLTLLFPNDIYADNIRNIRVDNLPDFGEIAG